MAMSQDDTREWLRTLAYVTFMSVCIYTAFVGSDSGDMSRRYYWYVAKAMNKLTIKCRDIELGYWQKYQDACESW
jgi:hypothetical protein